MSTTATMTAAARAATLAERRDALRLAEPRLYPRDIAVRLGVTEAELVALDEGRGGDLLNARRLRPEFVAILSDLHQLGPVMGLTRNADAVHEKHGIYPAFEGSAAMGLFASETIDLRLFLTGWKFAWEVVSAGRRSLQFYAGDGSAVHKIYRTEHTDGAAWEALVERYSDAGAAPIAVVAAPERAIPAADSTIDRAGLLAGWDKLRDTHQFHGLLRHFKVARTQALRLAGPERARPVAAGSLRTVLQAAAKTALPIMVFVGNRHCIQIHGGPVTKLLEAGPWFNVLDPGFNLHLRENAIVDAWVVTKPTADGPVTSLELFDAEGGAIATLFGLRKPGTPEIAAWRELALSLPELAPAG